MCSEIELLRLCLVEIQIMFSSRVIAVTRNFCPKFRLTTVENFDLESWLEICSLSLVSAFKWLIFGIYRERYWVNLFICVSCSFSCFICEYDATQVADSGKGAGHK